MASAVEGGVPGRRGDKIVERWVFKSNGRRAFRGFGKITVHPDGSAFFEARLGKHRTDGPQPVELRQFRVRTLRRRRSDGSMGTRQVERPA